MNIKTFLLASYAALLLNACSSSTIANPNVTLEDVKPILKSDVITNEAHINRISELLAEQQNVNLQDIEKAYQEAKLQQSIIKAMTTPGEAKPWHQYRQIFITDKRINQGVDFYLNNYEVLKRAADTYKVSPAIIVSIIGIETFYGRVMGNYRVVDALYTLGFNYEPRAAYFSKEFVNYVALAKQQNWDINTIKGSYAGAMGMGQFMPYSYLTWAVDFDGDGQINLFSNKNDAIGSVANYFKEHQWLDNGIIALEAKVKDKEIADSIIHKNLELTNTVSELNEKGITISQNIDVNEKCKLIKLETAPNEYTYYVAFNNFISIALYNKSPLYVMAVKELSEKISAKIPKDKL